MTRDPVRRTYHGVEEEPLLELPARRFRQIGETNSDLPRAVSPDYVAGSLQVGICLRKIDAQVQHSADLPGRRRLNGSTALADVEDLAQVQHHVVRTAVEAGVGRGVNFLTNGPSQTATDSLPNTIGYGAMGPEGLHWGIGPLILPGSPQKESYSSAPTRTRRKKGVGQSRTGSRDEPQARHFRCKGRMHDRRVMAATITLESNCMVATSR